MLVMLWHEALIDFDAQRFPGAVVIGISHPLDDVPSVHGYHDWATLEGSVESERGEALEPESFACHLAPEGDPVESKRVSYYRIKGGLWGFVCLSHSPFKVVMDISQRENGDWGLVLRYSGMLIQQWLPPGDYGDPMPMDPTLWDRLSRGGLEG